MRLAITATVLRIVFLSALLGATCGPSCVGQTTLAGKRFLEFAERHVFDDARGLFHFRSSENRFGHLTRPWETQSRTEEGEFSAGKGQLTIRLNSDDTGETTYSLDTLFRIDEHEAPVATHRAAHREFLQTSCRYSPTFLLRYICDRENADSEGDLKFTTTESEVISHGRYGDSEFSVYFSVGGELTQIEWRQHHELWGDQTTTIKYSEFKRFESTLYPASVVESTFDTETFRLKVLTAREASANECVEIPSTHALLTDDPPAKAEIVIEPFSDRLTFLHLLHTKSRVVVVEFADFLVVIDAPICSKNGQLILEKVKELHPDKRIKLFAFGHHHPHYLGGVRPFVAEGSTILTTKTVESYVRQLAQHAHSMQPDLLQQNPAPLKLQTFEEQTTISDGNYAMEVYDIGAASKHTMDYLLFYFPKEKMLFQDDGIWLRAGRPVNGRTQAIYEAVEKLELDVEKCVQGWPTVGYGVETIVGFDAIESRLSQETQLPSSSESL